MDSVSDSSAVESAESGVSNKSDLSTLIEDLCQSGFDDVSIQQSFDTALKDFEDCGKKIRETRVKKAIVVEKLRQQYNDHTAASELLKENAKLFEGIQEHLSPRSDSPSSVEERESFVSEKLLLEEAIEKYRNEIPRIESQQTMQMENLRGDHDKEQNLLRERKRSLESQIKTYIEDFERQKAELKVKHDKALEKLSRKFKSRLSEIEELGSHKLCESELASLRSSWNETLQRLAMAIERTRDEISGKRPKKRRTSSTKRVPEEHPTSSPNTGCVSLGGRDIPPMRNCTVVLERFEAAPGSSGYLNPSKSGDEVSSNASDETNSSCQPSSSTSGTCSAVKKRLFSEEQMQGDFGTITETAPNTIEEYLHTLQRIVSENAKEQKRLKRRKTP